MDFVDALDDANNGQYETNDWNYDADGTCDF